MPRRFFKLIVPEELKDAMERAGITGASIPPGTSRSGVAGPQNR